MLTNSATAVQQEAPRELEAPSNLGGQSSALQNHALDLMFSNSLAKSGKLGTADLVFHDIDETEANLLGSKTMALEEAAPSKNTNLSKNEGVANNLAVVVQDGKEYLDLNHEDPFAAAGRNAADHKIGIV